MCEDPCISYRKNNMRKKVKSYVKKGAQLLLDESAKKAAQQMEAKIDQRIDDLASYIEKKVDMLDRKLDRVDAIVTSSHDELPYLTRELYRLRSSSSYREAFSTNPLISVRIATYNRADQLINRAIASVLKQNYQNFEIVIVGDHCTDDTEKRIQKLNDRRIRFYNLPNRTVYPDDITRKWMVIGALPMNMAAGMTKGQWIAPLDDDDEFSADHLEKLLKHAQATHCELVYGATTMKELTSGKEKRIWAFPPEKGEFTFVGAMYMRELDSVFKYDSHSWTVDEVGDWNLCRRMMQSGVKISAIKDVIGTIHMIPAGHKRKDY